MTEPIYILGSGVAGLFCAEAFLRRGYQNLVVLGFSAPPYCASAAATGVSSVKGLFVAESNLFTQKLRGHEHLRMVLESFDIKAFGRVIEPFSEQNEFAYLSQRIYRNAYTAPYGTEYHAIADDKNGLLAKGIAGYLSYPADYCFDSEAVLTQLKSRLQQRGVQFIATEIAGLKLNDGCYELKFEGAVAKTKQLILASGRDIGRHCADLGLNYGEWRSDKGASFVADNGHEANEEVAVIHKTRALCYGRRIVVGAHKDHPSSVAEALKAWQPYLMPQVWTTLQKLSWQRREGERMRLHGRHHEPLASVVKQNEMSCRVGIIGGFHKSGWQLAGVYAERLLEQWAS